jgi:hypothetical protein
MKRIYKYPNDPVSISFKTAFVLVVLLHLFGGLLYFGVTRDSNKPQSKRSVIDNNSLSSGPISDSLDRNWRKKPKQSPIKVVKQPVLTNKVKTSEMTSVQQMYPQPTEYKLAPGDNFYTVSKKLGISFQQLVEYNNIVDVRSLRVGQVIKVPQKS